MSQLSLDKFGENIPVSGVVAFSQVAIGLGVGLLVSDRVSGVTRRALAISLIATGVAALVPVVAGIASAVSHRPGSRRTMNKRLDSIRHDSGFSHDENAV